MKKPPLYPHRAEIVRAIGRQAYPWARQLAERIDAQLKADERRAETAHKGPQAYSAELQEKIIAAVPPRTLSDSRCAVLTLDRIEEYGCETFGMKRVPDIDTVRSAVIEARRRSAVDLQAIRLRKLEPVTGFPFAQRGASLSSSTLSAST